MDKNFKPFPWHDVATKEFFYESHFYFSMFLLLVNTQPIKAHNVFVGSYSHLIFPPTTRRRPIVNLNLAVTICSFLVQT